MRGKETNMMRTQRVCQVCGKAFWGVYDAHYCVECAENLKGSSVMRIRTCADCGADFPGGPRAKRCPECRVIARRKGQKEYRKNGTARPLGSTDKCKICGNIYTVSSSRQLYCAECKREANLEWQREHKKGYWRKPDILERRQEKRENQQKVCVYCLRHFKSNKPESYCSDYCRKEQEKYFACIYDIKRGQSRNIAKYEAKRNNYREFVKSSGAE